MSEKKNLTTRTIGLIMILAMFIILPQNVAKASTEFENGKISAQTISYNTDYSGTIETGSEVNWYKLQSVSYTAYYNIQLKNIDLGGGNSDTLTLKVLDSDGAEVGGAYAARATETTNYVKLEKNQTYYIKAYSKFGYSGNYKFSVIAEKDAADTMEESDSISLSKTYTHSFPQGKDNDWFKLKTGSKTDYYQFSLKNINIGESSNADQVYMVIYDKDGLQVDSIYAGYSSTTTKEINLKRNKTYYILCYSNWGKTGDYKFSLKTVDDAGGTKKQAQTVKTNKTYKYKINSAGDVDWYKIKLTKKGNYVFSLKDIDISGYNLADLDMYVYNSSGKKIAKINTYKGKTTKKTVKNLAKGTYYLKISSKYQYSGNYTFKVIKK